MMTALYPVALFLHLLRQQHRKDRRKLDLLTLGDLK